MSSTTAQTVYSVSVNSADSQIFFNFDVLETAVTDAEVVALVQGLQALPWPAAASPVSVYVSKAVYNNTQYNYNATTNPPSFD